MAEQLGFFIRDPKGPFITGNSVDSIMFPAQKNGTKQRQDGDGTFRR